MLSSLDRDASPTRALIPIAPNPNPDWQPILHVSNQVVLYNPTSHALTIRASSPPRRRSPATCPFCNRPMPSTDEDDDEDEDEAHGSPQLASHSRASNYFQLLAIANESSSRPPTRPSTPPSNDRRSGAFSPDAMADGYFRAFFKEEYRLGMGANGSVYLCQHMLDGNPLGRFAVKKIAVGESHAYLLKILKEVRLLERLHHPNIITYHHAWLETSQFSSFGPKVPTLHVLMQWAEGGSLDDFIDVRLGRSTATLHGHSPSSSNNPYFTSSSSPFPSRFSSASSIHTPIQQPPLGPAPAPDLENRDDPNSRGARIRAFRALQHAPPEERERLRREFDAQFNLGTGSSANARTTWTAVHLLSAEEVRSLFGDVVEGLAFLHDKSILHLDLKPGNVLLTWDGGRLIPRAMLSDFGTSRDMLHSSSKARSGNTGTLEYSSPESLPAPHTGLLAQIDSKADMWSLGMILHKLLFFRLPYQHASDADVSGGGEAEKMDKLEKEVLSYAGFKSTPLLVKAFETRRLPRAFLVLLESLLNVVPASRPSSERVLGGIRGGRLDPVSPSVAEDLLQTSSLIPVVRHPSPPAALTPQASRHSDETVSPVDQSHQEILDKVNGDRCGDTDDIQTEGQHDNQAPLLTLPAPVPRRSHIPRAVYIRVLKSCILVAKVLSISSCCSPEQLHSVAQALLLMLAVTDTLFDRLDVSTVLCAVHVGAMWAVCGAQCRVQWLRLW